MADQKSPVSETVREYGDVHRPVHPNAKNGRSVNVHSDVYYPGGRGTNNVIITNDQVHNEFARFENSIYINNDKKGCNVWQRDGGPVKNRIIIGSRMHRVVDVGAYSIDKLFKQVQRLERDLEEAKEVIKYLVDKYESEDA